jgi:hypothetical protein
MALEEEPGGAVGDNGGFDWRWRREQRTSRPGGGGECSGSGGRYDGGMANRPNDLPPGSAVVITNPDEDCSPEAFHALLDDLLAGPEPELESLDAAEASRELRAEAEA